MHTPLITGQDCEGAGDVPGNNDGSNKITEEAKVDEQDFFKKPVSLTVSGQLAGETFCTGIPQYLYIWTNFQS